MKIIRRCKYCLELYKFDIVTEFHKIECCSKSCINSHFIATGTGFNLRKGKVPIYNDDKPISELLSEHKQRMVIQNG